MFDLLVVDTKRHAPDTLREEYDDECYVLELRLQHFLAKKECKKNTKTGPSGRRQSLGTVSVPPYCLAWPAVQGQGDRRDFHFPTNQAAPCTAYVQLRWHPWQLRRAMDSLHIPLATAQPMLRTVCRHPNSWLCGPHPVPISRSQTDGDGVARLKAVGNVNSHHFVLSNSRVIEHLSMV